MRVDLMKPTKNIGYYPIVIFCTLATITLFGCSSTDDPGTTSESPAQVVSDKSAVSAAPTAAPKVAPTAAPTEVPKATKVAVVPTSTATKPVAKAKADPTATPIPEPTPEPAKESGIDDAAAAGAAAAASVFPFDRFTDFDTCPSGSSKDDQKAVLARMANKFFAGTTTYDEEMPRITHLGGTPLVPNARDDRRSGGIWLIVEFNGDDNGDVFEKKGSVDLWMRESYNAFYNSGCDQLAKVEISAYGEAIGRHPIGPAAASWAITFKTRLNVDVAKEVNWAYRENINFDEIWETMILNYRWKQDLAGEDY